MNHCDQNQRGERWLPVPGFEHRYQVSDLGRVRRLGSKAVKRLSRTHNGYLAVTLWDGGRCRGFKVHRLVLEAFGGRPFRRGEETNHKDGVKTNNRLTNLEVVSAKENVAHAIRTGLRDYRGEKHPRAKLTEGDAREIRLLHAGGSRAGGVTQVSLAKKFGVSKDAIYSIIKRRNWKHLED
jgi:hypothetical protein